MNILHISDTTLSGAPYRLSKLLRDHQEGLDSRHIVWAGITRSRVFRTDMVGEDMSIIELKKWWDWADIVHWHNRMTRSVFSKIIGCDPLSKPGALQIHSPRDSENFEKEVESLKGRPLLIIGQYHPRQWKETPHIVVPNAIDIYDDLHKPRGKEKLYSVPVVSFSPSNSNAKDWDDKGYDKVAPYLKKRSLQRRNVRFQLIYGKPHEIAMNMKNDSDIGIDEIVTGSYHMSSLEYLSLGKPCLSGIDDECQEVVCELTGSEKYELPWVITNPSNFKKKISELIEDKTLREGVGARSRRWMKKFWNPEAICKHYWEVYKKL